MATMPNTTRYLRRPSHYCRHTHTSPHRLIMKPPNVFSPICRDPSTEAFASYKGGRQLTQTFPFLPRMEHTRTQIGDPRMPVIRLRASKRLPSKKYSLFLGTSFFGWVALSYGDAPGRKPLSVAVPANRKVKPLMRELNWC
jgi:hypothetical protein